MEQDVYQAGQADFNLPHDIVELPSGGVFYKNKKKSVKVGYLTAAAPEGVAVMTDIGSYLDFVTTMFVSFGVAFEVPIAVVLLVRFNLVSVASLKEARSYVIVGAFIIGAILTPPDVISQVMLALPLWMLYEAGVLVARFVEPKPELVESV